MEDKFGKVEHVYIPPLNQQMGGPIKRTQIAIIRFKNKESATRAVTDGEIVVEFAALRIERALAKPRPNREDGDRPPRQFDGSFGERREGGGFGGERSGGNNFESFQKKRF